MTEENYISENEKEYLNIIESILFAVGDRVDVKTIAQALELSLGETRLLMDKLASLYDYEMRGMKIIKTDSCYQMVTRGEYFDYVKKVIVKHSTTTLSQAALETLAIVAYKQPVTRLEIDTIRGVKSSSSLNLLLDRALVKRAGKREDVLGKPMTFATTEEFLRLAGIESLEDLPDFENFIEGIEQIEENTEAEQLSFDSITEE